jgi:hypothetical protein
MPDPCKTGRGGVLEPEEIFGDSAQRQPDVPYSAQIQNATGLAGQSQRQQVDLKERLTQFRGPGMG